MAESKKRVLLAEDDKFICKAYKEGLERAGFEVEIANNGEEALEKMRASAPDILLLDIIMPIKNGFEVLQEIKLDTSLAGFPVMVLSNLGQESDVVRAKDLGAVDYLIKSNHTLAAVLEKVKEYVVAGAK